MDSIKQRMAAWLADYEDPSLLAEAYSHGTADKMEEAAKDLLSEAYQILSHVYKEEN